MNTAFRWLRSGLTAGLLLATLAACDEPLTAPQLIVRTRVLAARVQVDSDPSRATPAPSERVTLRVLAVDPSVDIPFTWQLRACSSTPVAYGLPACAAEPFATSRQDTPLGGEPSWVFDVPSETVLGDAPALLVEGVVCSRGTPTEGGTACGGDGADGDRVSIPIALQRYGANRNPSLADDVVELDGSEWAAPMALDAGACSPGSTLPSVKGGSREHVIRVTVRGGDRDHVSGDELSTGGAGPWETLQLDYYVTAGELTLASSFVEADDPRRDAVLSVRWSAPEEPPEEVQLVRVYFVSRDLRGGSDWAVRALCLVP